MSATNGVVFYAVVITIIRLPGLAELDAAMRVVNVILAFNVSIPAIPPDKLGQFLLGCHQEIDIGHTCTFHECPGLNVAHSGWNYQLGERRAVVERLLADCLQPLGQYYKLKTGATTERTLVNISNALVYNEISDVLIVLKSPTVDALDIAIVQLTEDVQRLQGGGFVPAGDNINTIFVGVDHTVNNDTTGNMGGSRGQHNE